MSRYLRPLRLMGSFDSNRALSTNNKHHHRLKCCQRVYEYDFMRRWTYTRLGEKVYRHERFKRPTPPSIEICSYNVLSQALLEKNFSLYQDIDPKFLLWSNRKKALLDEMSFQKADIYCLQEVDAYEFVRCFEPFFSAMGYEGAYKGRLGDKCDGCAIFFKRHRFSLIDKLSFSYIRGKSSLLDRANVALLLKLNMTDVDYPVVVGATHLLFNPNCGDVKLAQSQLLLAELERFALDRIDVEGRRIYYPIVMTGDFNSSPNSATYQLMSGNVVDLSDWTAGNVSGQFFEACSDRLLPATLIPFEVGISDQCRYSRSMVNVRRPLRHSHATLGKPHIRRDSYGSERLQSMIPMKSAYQHFDESGHAEVSTKHRLNEKGHCWDFIFFSVKDTSDVKLELLATLDLATTAISKHLLFPSKRCGSDHLSLFAKFAVVRNDETSAVDTLQQ